jgi:peptide/nickel transport system substrate-binding protein
MRRRIVLILLVLFMVSMAACGKKTPTPKVQAGAQSGGTLVYVAGGAPENLDPATTPGNWDARVMRSIYDTLVWVDASQKIYPYLATSWEQSADGTVFTIKLRTGVKFQDGTAFNAAAVKFNFDRFGDPKVGVGTIGQYFLDYVGTEVVDENTVKVTFKTPKSVLIPALGDPFSSIASPTAVQKWGKDYGQHPVGTGPFMLESWDPGQQLTLVKNPDYNWAPEVMKHQGPAYLDKVIFRTVAESQTRVAVLKTGEAAVSYVPPTAMADFTKDPAFYIVPGVPPGETGQQMLNTKRFPTDDLAVRKALIYATDQAAIEKAVTFGTREVSHSVLARTTLDFDQTAEDMYRFDLAKAKQILEEAGWKDTNGDGIREKDGKDLQVYWPAYAGEKAYAELLMAQWKAAGIDTKFEALDDAAAWEAAGAGNFNITNMASVNFDASVLYPLFHSSNSQGYAFTAYADPKLDAALLAGVNAANAADRKAAYATAQRIIMEQALIVPMSTLDSSIVVRAEYVGVTLDWESYYPIFYDAYIKK